MNTTKSVYQSIINFLRTKLTRIQLMIVIAVLVGFISGILSVILKITVHSIQSWISKIPLAGYSFLLFPIAGLLLTVVITQRFFSGHFEKGISMVLKAIARKSSVIPFSHTYKHLITSSITVSMGGSVGLEAPIVATGAA